MYPTNMNKTRKHFYNITLLFTFFQYEWKNKTNGIGKEPKYIPQ